MGCDGVGRGGWAVGIHEVSSGGAVAEYAPRMIRLTLAGLLPYRWARRLLSEFLPLGKPQTVETTRQRTLRVSARLEQEAVAGGGAKPAMAAKTITLSIDGGHVQVARQDQGCSFEVLLGQVSSDKERRSCSAACRRRRTRRHDNYEVCFMHWARCLRYRSPSCVGVASSR
jgi:hypothetical protein